MGPGDTVTPRDTVNESGQAVPRTVAVVPHTHWDREWYDPFQTFRVRLVRLVDGLLDQMEADGSFTHFLLDGQLAVLDDYLEIRPENRGRIEALAASGRLTVGPWYILMDEFLVSGETIVRNLQQGIRTGSGFGGVMEVGYLPDMFGHVAQMPQILRAAGFEHAVVWRGVPSAVDRTAFVWHAPDGSEVRAEYLVAGYGNGAALPQDAKALARRLRTLVEEFGGFLGPDDPLLVMNGTDHQRPQPWLGRVVAEVNQLQNELAVSISSLPEYLAGAPTAGLPHWHGELRSGARSNLLMGVASNRVDVKQAAARAERWLERTAEPLSALFLPAEAWREPFLQVAWTLMIRNSAHDSVCACSIDDVVDAVLHRYAEARHIGEALAGEALGAVAASLSAPGPVAVNPTSRDRGGLVDVVVTASGDPGPDVQVLSERAGLPGTVTLDATTVRSMLGLIQGARIDTDTYITDVSLAEDETGVDITIVIGTEPREGVPVEEIKRELYSLLSARPDTEVRVSLDQPPVRRILARQEVPGFGWSRISPAHLHHPATAGAGASGEVTLDNGLLAVSVDPVGGTFAVNGIPGFGQLVDSGDFGDTYTYSPPAADTVVDTPDHVTVTVDEQGPVRSRVTVTSTYTWPDRVDGSTRSRVGAHSVTVRTTLELQAEESVLRVRTRFDNPARDHRVRVRLPLPVPDRTSRAECAFTVVERGLVAEGRAEEVATPTFPSRRFVTSGGLTVVHEGLLEYELIDLVDGDGDGDGDGARATALALTILRSTGMLSRMGLSTRPMTAGPMTPLEGPQRIGPVDVTYAIAIGDVDPYRLADDVLVPLATAGSFGGGDRPDRGAELTVRGAEVSSVRRQAGQVEVRVFNPRPEATSVEIPGRAGWLVDLRGRTLAPFEGGFELRGHGIATARLDGD